MKLYKQLNKNECFFIDHCFNVEHLSMRLIANMLGRNVSTISREIKRNSTNGIYFHEKANIFKTVKSRHKHAFYLSKYEEFTKLFVKHYDKRYSGVEVTIYKIKTMNLNIKIPSIRQVFRWINSNRWKIKRKDRLRTSYVKGRKRKVGIFAQITNKYVFPIWTRPKSADLRLEEGHFEADLIIGKQYNGYQNIVTLNDRKTRKLYATFVRSKDPWKVNEAFRKMIKDNNLKVKTLTLDNGIEFERIGILAKHLNFKVYLCDPYASFQRGSNEHLNGMIRRMWKKGTDFNLVSNEELQRVINLINNMPRKKFNWYSANQMR